MLTNFCRSAITAKQWLLNQTKSVGELTLDEGVVKAIEMKGKSLCPLELIKFKAFLTEEI